MVNLKDFIKGNEVMHTEVFQQAVDYCYEKGGEPLFIPFGTYTLGTVVLKDNTTLIFEDGAKILGSKDIDDFFVDAEQKPKEPKKIQCPHCEEWFEV